MSRTIIARDKHVKQASTTYRGAELADEQHGVGSLVHQNACDGGVALHRIPPHLLALQRVGNGVRFDKSRVVHGAYAHALAHPEGVNRRRQQFQS